MPIRAFTQEIGIKPSGGQISEFSTSLPTPDISGVTRFANTLSDIGEEMMKADAKQNAENAAAGVQIVKNEDGTYDKIKAPESFGPYARNIFNAAVDQNYINTVYRDTEAKLNEIAAKRTKSPEARIAEMDAHIDGVLKNVDPKFVGVLGPIFGRERNQRQGSILNLAAAEDKAALSANFTRDIQASMNDITNRLMVGDEVGAQSVEENLYGSVRALAHLNTEDQHIINDEVTRYKQTIDGLRFISPILKEVKDGVAKGTVLPDDISTLANMLTLEASQDATAFGVTGKDIVDNMNESALKEVRGLVGNIYKDYVTKFKVSAENARAQEVQTLLSKGNVPFLPADYSQDDLYNAAKLTVGADIYNPQAIRDLGYTFNGVLPEEAYKRFFKDAYLLDPTTDEGKKILTRQLFAYETLGSLTTANGTKDRTDVVGDSKDRNFFRIVSAQMSGANPKSLEVAVKTAQEAIKSGLAMDEGARNTLVRTKYREASGSEPTDQNILTAVTSNMSTSIDVTAIPFKARNAIMESIALSTSQGIDFDTAAKDAARDFDANWKESNTIISPEGGIGQKYVPAKSLLPQVIDPVSRKASDGYIDGSIKTMLDTTVNTEMLADYGVDPKSLKFRDNVRLEPANVKGENTYYLVYYNQQIGTPIRLRDKDNQTIMINPTKAAKAYDEYLVEKNLSLTVQRRKEIENDPTLRGSHARLPSFEDWAKSNNKLNIEDLSPSDRYNAYTGRNVKSSATNNPTVEGYKKQISDALSDKTELIPIMTKVLGFESAGFNPNAKNTESSAHGIGQITDDTWNTYSTIAGKMGRKLDRNNPQDQIWVATQYGLDVSRKFEATFNRKPSTGEFYVLYQQGPTGGARLLMNPDQRAIDVLTPVYKDRRVAVKAVTNNLKTNLRNHAANITARDFVKIIKGYVE